MSRFNISLLELKHTVGEEQMWLLLTNPGPAQPTVNFLSAHSVTSLLFPQLCKHY